MPGITREDWDELSAVVAESMPEPLKRLVGIYEREGDSPRFAQCALALVMSLDGYPQEADYGEVTKAFLGDKPIKMDGGAQIERNVPASYYRGQKIEWDPTLET